MSCREREMKAIHQCKSMENSESWIAKEDKNWLLNINRVATEQDLEENHHLEEVGQTIEHIALNIQFCPYCGERLGESQGEIIPSFWHHDYSKW